MFSSLSLSCDILAHLYEYLNIFSITKYEVLEAGYFFKTASHYVAPDDLKLAT